ncbi:MAG: NUDIX hydrolase [Chloroflexia bacterium]|nr:NUDIX hydrolase [Chloroflexia bacterium]
MTHDLPERPGSQPRPPGPFAYCSSCGSPNEIQERDGRHRPVCTACGYITFLDPKLAVAALIVRDGQILLGKRGPGTRSPGKWSFPAGFVERGEQVEAATAREVREETGLDVEPGALVGLFSEPGETVVLAVYEATLNDTGAVPVAADDLVDLDWFPLARLPELAFERDYRIIECLLGGQKVVRD